MWGRKLPSISKITDGNPLPDQVPDNANIGAVVGIVASADDQDSAVTYQLNSNANGMFSVDEKTGIVTVAKLLDYEAKTQHDIAISAISADTSQSQRKFHIKVIPVNEAAVSPITNAHAGFAPEQKLFETAKVGDRVGVDALGGQVCPINCVWKVSTQPFVAHALSGHCCTMPCRVIDETYIKVR